MFYIMNKDTKLVSFYWDAFQSSFRLKEILADNVPNYIWEYIIIWIDSRIADDNRENIHDIISSLGFPDCYGILNTSCGLSLTDTLWIKTDETEHLKWDDVNHYDNPFNAEIANAAFSGLDPNVKLPLTRSPEFSTDGALPKCWVRDESDDIYLVKDGSSGGMNCGNEPYSELMATELLSALGYNHVNYTVDTFRGKTVSKCKNMTDKSTSFIPMSSYCICHDMGEVMSFCTMNNIEEDLYKMFVFDFISNNNDRHGGNYGVLVDADTLAIKSFAPIFDNGYSFLPLYVIGDDLDWYLNRYVSYGDKSYDELAKVAKEHLGNKHNVDKLIGFKFKDIHDTDFSKERIKFIENFIQNRVMKFLSW